MGLLRDEIAGSNVQKRVRGIVDGIVAFHKSENECDFYEGAEERVTALVMTCLRDAIEGEESRCKHHHICGNCREHGTGATLEVSDEEVQDHSRVS
jgi:hypothetical protein